MKGSTITSIIAIIWLLIYICVQGVEGMSFIIGLCLGLNIMILFINILEKLKELTEK